MSLNREELLAALKLAEPALASKGPNPAWNNYLFSEVAVLAFDDLLAIKVPYKSGLSGCLPGASLLGVLSSSGATELEVLSMEGSVLKAKLGRSKLELPMGKTADFKFEEPKIQGAKAVPLTADLLGGLAKVSVALGWDSLQPWSFGVTLAPAKGGLQLLATNNFSMARVVVAEKFTLEEAALLPPRFVESLLRHTKRDPAVRLYVWEAGDWVAASFESGAVMYCRTSPQADPTKYEEVLAGLMSGELLPIPKSLDGSLGRARVFLTSPVVSERVALFRVSKDRLHVEVGTDRGSLRDVHKFPGHADVSIKAPPELILAALPHTERLGFVPDRAVRMQGPGFDYVISGAV